MARTLDSYQPLVGLSAIKDIHSTYCNMSENFSKLLGWKSPKDCIGKTDNDIPCDVNQFAEEFVKTDQKILTNQKQIITVDLQNYCSGWKLLLVEKNVFKDKQGKSIGIYLQALDLSATSLFQGYRLLYKLDEKIIGKSPKPISYLLSDVDDFFSLTEKQQECLFYLTRGKSIKQIAKRLGISPRTVESHLDTIKNKLQCDSKSELIEKVIDSGFLYSVPKRLFRTIFNISNSSCPS